MKTGAELIAEERSRQVEQEGYGPDHDDEQHQRGELVSAAIAYCLVNTVAPVREADRFAGSFWPWTNDDWKPKGHVEDLVRAGALIAAEIDRYQRLQERIEKAGPVLDCPTIITPEGFQR